MAVEYDISSDVAVIKETGSVSQCARVTQMYSGQITYDDEAGSKFATATINGKSQRVMLCIAVSGTVTYDDVPSLYSTVDGHRCLNIVTPTETGTPDDVPSLYETVVIDGQNVRAVRCIMINKTPVYDGVSSTCTFTGDDGKTHTAQLVNKVTGGSVVVIIKGTSPLNLPDAIANSLSYVKAFGGTEQNGTPTPDAPMDIVSNNGVVKPNPNEYDSSSITVLNLAYVGTKLTTNNDRYGVAIPVQPNTEYMLFVNRQKAANNYLNVCATASYPANNVGVLGYYTIPAAASAVTFTTPAAARYVYVYSTIPLTWLTDADLQLRKVGAYADGTVETIELTGANIFNYINVPDENKYINAATGSTSAPSSGVFRYSGYIPIKGGVKYFFGITPFLASAAGVAWYSGASVSAYISGVSGTSLRAHNMIETAPNNAKYVRFSFRIDAGYDVNWENTVYLCECVNNTPIITSYEPYYNGGTATAEMLLKVDDYQDEQEILSGVVTRKVGVLVLDGTESWTKTTSGSNWMFYINSSGQSIANGLCVCNVATGRANSWTSLPDMVIVRSNRNFGFMNMSCTTINSTVDDWKQWLADQYAAGTPVIIVYPLATPTTETVTGQTLQVTDGDNVLEITQASLTGLELEAQYNAAVSLTIQEVQDANLDNNVTVTIQ